MRTLPFGHKNTPKILTQTERLPTDPDQILKREAWLSANVIAASQRGDVATCRALLEQHEELCRHSASLRGVCTATSRHRDIAQRNTITSTRKPMEPAQ